MSLDHKSLCDVKGVNDYNLNKPENLSYKSFKPYNSVYKFSNQNEILLKIKKIENKNLDIKSLLGTAEAMQEFYNPKSIKPQSKYRWNELKKKNKIHLIENVKNKTQINAKENFGNIKKGKNNSSDLSMLGSLMCKSDKDFILGRKLIKSNSQESIRSLLNPKLDISSRSGCNSNGKRHYTNKTRGIGSIKNLLDNTPTLDIRYTKHSNKITNGTDFFGLAWRKTPERYNRKVFDNYELQKNKNAVTPTSRKINKNTQIKQSLEPYILLKKSDSNSNFIKKFNIFDKSSRNKTNKSGFDFSTTFTKSNLIHQKDQKNKLNII